MLSYIRDVSHSWFVRIVFFIVLIVFAFFGVYSYLNQSGVSGGSIAEISGARIEVDDFQNAYQNYIDSNPNAANEEQSELKLYILESLVNEALVTKFAEDLGLVYSPRYVANLIVNDQNFFTDGRFDRRKYDDYLTQNRISATELESSLAKNYQLNLFNNFMQLAAVDTSEDAQKLWQATSEKTKLLLFQLTENDLRKNQTASEADLVNFYAQNNDRYQAAANFDLDFVALSGQEEVLGGTIQNTPEKRQEFYQNNQLLFTAKAATNTAHIFFANQPGSDNQENRETAERIYQELQQSPEKFAEYAKQYSDDPSNKDQGGDLGWHQKGDFLAEYEQAVDLMEVGQISPPISTQLGLHIIKLIDRRGDTLEPYDDAQVQTVMLEQTRSQRLQQAYDQWQNNFTSEQYANIAQEKTPESLSAFEGVSTKVFNSFALYDQLKQQDATYGVFMGDNQLIAYHVKKRTPAQTEQYDKVKDKVRQDFLLDKGKNSLSAQIQTASENFTREQDAVNFFQKLNIKPKTIEVDSDGRSATALNLNNSLLKTAFLLNEQNSFLQQTLDNQIVFFLFDEKIPAAEPSTEDFNIIRQYLARVFDNQKVSFLVNSLRDRYRVNYNPDLMKYLGIKVQ